MTVCELCGVDSTSLDQHKRNVHLNNVLCECCDKIFLRPYHLKVHLMNKAKKVNDCDNDPCEHCGKKFKTKKSRGHGMTFTWILIYHSQINAIS